MSCGAMRVDGQAVVTRGIGHTAVRRSLVLRPEISVYPRGDLDFVVLGNSQLWRVLSAEEVVNHVASYQQGGAGSRVGSPMPSQRGSAWAATHGALQSLQQGSLLQTAGSKSSSLSVSDGGRRTSGRTTGTHRQNDPSTSPLPSLSTSQTVRSARDTASVRSNQSSSFTDVRSGASQSVVQEAQARLQTSGKKEGVNVMIAFLADNNRGWGGSRGTYCSGQSRE